jgi:hypothetical protein
MLFQLAETLVENRRLETHEAILAYERAVLALRNEPRDARVLPHLLSAFCDSQMPLDVKDDEMMWSLVYYVESFETEDYVNSLIQLTPTLLLDAQQWLDRLYVAILNSDDYSQALKTALQQASPEQQDAVRKTLQYILASPSLTDIREAHAKRIKFVLSAE